jgi:hypothetical protein
MSRPLTLLLVLGAALAACGGSDESRRLTRRSWIATARLAEEGWRDGRLPRRYAADTLHLAARELGDASYDRTADAVERGER